jgi:hypothetical protein
MTQAELADKAGVTVARLATALGTTTTDLLPVTAEPDPLPVPKEQATQMLDALLQTGDRESFQQLNPFLALLVKASARRSANAST